eukprot:UN12906
MWGKSLLLRKVVFFKFNGRTDFHLPYSNKDFTFFFPSSKLAVLIATDIFVPVLRLLKFNFVLSQTRFKSSMVCSAPKSRVFDNVFFCS